MFALQLPGRGGQVKGGIKGLRETRRSHWCCSAVCLRAARMAVWQRRIEPESFCDLANWKHMVSIRQHASELGRCRRTVVVGAIVTPPNRTRVLRVGLVDWKCWGSVCSSEGICALPGRSARRTIALTVEARMVATLYEWLNGFAWDLRLQRCILAWMAHLLGGCDDKQTRNAVCVV